MNRKSPISHVVIGWATVLGGLALLVAAFLIIFAGAGLLAGAGSFQIGAVWFIGGFRYLFSGALLVVTGLGLVSLKTWARYSMFLVAVILYMVFREAILNTLLYKICFVNLILVIIYLFRSELQDRLINDRRVG
jgi:hypothetical protein